jgi:hypothetical protein
MCIICYNIEFGEACARVDRYESVFCFLTGGASAVFFNFPGHTGQQVEDKAAKAMCFGDRIFTFQLTIRSVYKTSVLVCCKSKFFNAVVVN